MWTQKRIRNTASEVARKLASHLAIFLSSRVTTREFCNVNSVARNTAKLSVTWYLTLPVVEWFGNRPHWSWDTCVFWEKQQQRNEEECKLFLSANLVGPWANQISKKSRTTFILVSASAKSYHSKEKRWSRKHSHSGTVVTGYMYVIQICNGEFRYKSTDCMHAGQLNKHTHVYIHVCILWRDKHTHITLRGTGTVVSQTPELKTLVNNRSVTGRAP